MNINHDLLCALGVGHPSLTAVRETSTSCGGRACKLTGAGGGGCAVTLLGLEASSALSSEQRSSETLLIEKLWFVLRLLNGQY
jgi:mevalonate kinase